MTGVPHVLAPSAPDWRERWLALRDRLLASRRFHRFAAAFPLTRPIARRETQALFDLCAGFVYSQVLLACVRLRLFDRLRDGPQPIDDLASVLDLPADAARRLLDGAAALRLVERSGELGYRLGSLGAVLAGNPGLLAMVEHHAALYRDLADPVALLRGGGRATDLGSYWSYASADRPQDLQAPDVASYTALMSASQPMIAEEVLAVAPLAGRRCLLDVGGGDGAFLAAVAARHPELGLALFDLPAVIRHAEKRLAGLGARLVGGDFRRDPLPEGADTISLVRVLHDHDDPVALALLRAARAALRPGGRLIIAEPMVDGAGGERIGRAYFGIYLYAMGQGRPRSSGELQGLLADAGFMKARLLPGRNTLLARVMVADC